MTEASSHSGSDALDRVLSAWNLSDSEAADVFGVDRQTVSRWKKAGVPASRATTLEHLLRATELLERRVEQDSIPAIVRRSADAPDGRSLLDLAQCGNTAAVVEAVRRMFDLRRVQP